jgi:hypothetical protein
MISFCELGSILANSGASDFAASLEPGKRAFFETRVVEILIEQEDVHCSLILRFNHCLLLSSAFEL